MAGIYIHIPFCKTHCTYCDFYSTTRSGLKDRYIHALCRELHLRKEYLDGEEIETIYFGGGTPSQLSPENFRKIFDIIYKVYGMEKCKEITLEANPDDLCPDYLQGLSQLPFNRISIGIQTFNNNILKLLNRRHSPMQAVQAVAFCREAGFENISIDLMYGLPGEDKQIWKEDLEKAIGLDVEHISAYHLIYEEGTPLYRMLKRHKVEEVDEDSSADFFAAMVEKLTQAGYVHYEISSFCRPGRLSLHNSSYWTGKKYLGCGPSAHSYNGAERAWNISSLKTYMESIGQGLVPAETDKSDLHTRYNDFIITSLRTMWGLPLQGLKEQFGEELYAYCLKNAQTYIGCGKLAMKGNNLILSKNGIFVSDGIMSDLLWVDE